MELAALIPSFATVDHIASIILILLHTYYTC
jgi:hypothetical protein